MLTVTLDTGALCFVEALNAVAGIDADVATTTVTAREVAGTGWASHLEGLKVIHEDLVLGESWLGSAVLGSAETADRYERLLLLLSGGGFPKPGNRDDLSEGQKHVQRDAMIFSAHARDGRDILVSEDRRAIGQPNSSLRQRLVDEFGIRAMTVDEFKRYCASLRGDGVGNH
jgi:hypothetical protein